MYKMIIVNITFQLNSTYYFTYNPECNNIFFTRLTLYTDFITDFSVVKNFSIFYLK